LQSITWEAKRRLFDEDLPKAVKGQVEQVWQDYHIGRRSLTETQDERRRTAFEHLPQRPRLYVQGARIEQSACHHLLASHWTNYGLQMFGNNRERYEWR